jgi:hypothetical protein
MLHGESMVGEASEIIGGRIFHGNDGNDGSYGRAISGCSTKVSTKVAAKRRLYVPLVAGNEL